MRDPADVLVVRQRAHRRCQCAKPQPCPKTTRERVSWSAVDSGVGVLRRVEVVRPVDQRRDAAVERLEPAEKIARVGVFGAVELAHRAVQAGEVVGERPVGADIAEERLPGVPVGVDHSGQHDAIGRVDDLGVAGVERRSDGAMPPFSIRTSPVSNRRRRIDGDDGAALDQRALGHRSSSSRQRSGVGMRTAAARYREQPRRRGVQGFCTTVRYASTGCPIAGTRRPDLRDPRQPRGAQADSAARRAPPRRRAERRAARWRPPMDPRSRRSTSRRRTARACARSTGSRSPRPPAPCSACSGPNGAGKSTTVKILTTLAPPRLRHGARRRPRRAAPTRTRVRRAIGVVAQKSGADRDATGRENLRAPGPALRHARRRAAPARVDELLDRFGLADAADRTVEGVLRRHAAPARRRARPGAPARGALPRRADHRPRPGGARRDVAGDRPPGRARRA